jgi:hypothetical protein
MGVRNDAIASASSFGKRYLSCRTQSSGQYRSLLICRSSPSKIRHNISDTAGVGGVTRRIFAVEEL